MVKNKLFILVVSFFIVGIFSLAEIANATGRPLPNGTYRILNDKGEVLQETNGDLIWATWAGNDNQKWTFWYSTNWQFPEGYVISPLSKKSCCMY
ncbi:TPA: hypothetical protein ACGX4V_002271 [Enterococcus faecalis]